MDQARAPSRRRMRPISLITVANSTAFSARTRYSMATTIGPEADWISTLGGVSSTRALGSSAPIPATATGSQCAAASDTSEATPATVSEARSPATLANSPHHQLPSAMEANATVW